MSKHVFNYLNSSNHIQVDIVRQKYGLLNFWMDFTPAACSQFFRGLFHTTSYLKYWMWVKSLNPGNTSFLIDPQYYDIPIVLKHTYINMDLVLDNSNLTDLMSDSLWDINKLHNMFGNNVNTHFLYNRSMIMQGTNIWVWLPNSKSSKASSTIYRHLNAKAAQDDHWDGWNHLQKLNIFPRVKYFTWLLLRGRLKTREYLFHLKLGPQDM